MSRRGSSAGPSLTPRTSLPGARVRVTASTGLMAGAQGVITKGGEHPVVTFESGQELSFPIWKLQLMAPAPNPNAAFQPPGPVQVAPPVSPEVARTKPSHRPAPSAPKEKRKKIRRDDAKWNF